MTMWDVAVAPTTRRRSTSTPPRSTGRRTSAPSTCRRSSTTREPRSTPGKNKNDRTERLRRNVLSPERHLAAFDLENTLISSNVVESYSFLATRRLNVPERMRYVLRTLAEAPTLSSIDRKDRADFLRFFYRRYEDAPIDQIAEDSQGAARPADPHQELPRRPAPRARAPGTRSPHDAHHRRDGLRRRRAAPAVRRDRRGEDERATRRHLQRQPVGRAAHGRDPGADPGRLLRGRGAEARGEHRLRRLAAATCRCSKSSASPWP